MNKKIQNTTYLVTIDVNSLYTNIPTQEGINACLNYIDQNEDLLPNFTPNKRIMKTLFHFVLEHNYFLFNDKLYKQLQGTAMGTKVAPCFADLFLGKFEEDFILTPEITNKIKLYKRFLDDIFILWTGNLKELNTFIEYINNIHPTIKFTHKYSTKQIDFLDSTIYIDPETKTFKSKLYKKPTDTNSILHYSSYHPEHTKANIIQTQALRYRLLTTDDKILKKDLNKLKRNFLERGYPSSLITENTRKIENLKQFHCLYNKNLKNKHPFKYKPKCKNNKNLPFIIKYCEHFTLIQKILSKHWSTIQRDDELKKIYPKKPFVVYKRNKNIKDLLTKTRFSKIELPNHKKTV